MTKYQNTQHVKDATDTWYIYTYREKKFYFLHYSNKANSLLIFWLWIRGQVPPRPALRNRAFRKTWHRKAWLRTWQGHHKKTNYCLTCLRIRNRCWVLRIRCWPFQSRSRTPAKSKSWQMQIKRLKKRNKQNGASCSAAWWSVAACSFVWWQPLRNVTLQLHHNVQVKIEILEKKKDLIGVPFRLH